MKNKTASVLCSIVLFSGMNMSGEAAALITPDFEIRCKGQHPRSEHSLEIELNLKHKRVHPMAGPQLFGAARFASTDPDFLDELFPITTTFYYSALTIAGEGGLLDRLSYKIKGDSSLFIAGSHDQTTLEITSYPPLSQPQKEHIELVCITTDLSSMTR